MERDKLEKAAYNHAKIMGDVPEINSTHAFKSGAEWLMQQPLSERLREEEITKLNNLVFSMRGMGAAHQMSYGCLQNISEALYDIFGLDIFEPQRECVVVNMANLRQRNV